MTSPASTIEYYEVFEAALSALTSVRGEYRRHFGAHRLPAPAGYCFFKAVTAPERHPEFADWLCEAGTLLEEQLLSALPRVKPRKILDVGCGNGALLRRLAREQPDVALTGINFQPQQVETARRLLAGTGAEIVLGDFREQSLPSDYDVAYLFESAFHMPNKTELCQRLAQLLSTNGEVWLIDIVVAERAAETFQNMGQGGVFNYVPRRQWQTSFGKHGLEEIEFVDLSRGAAEVLQVSDIATLERDYFVPRLRAAMSEVTPVAEDALRHASSVMVRIATEYRRLSRLLRGGMLEYVLMRYRKSS